MRTLLLIPFILVGCASDPCVPTSVEVYKYPEFTMPMRPELQDTSPVMTDGVVVRVLKSNLIDIMNYAEQLETTLSKLKKPGDTK